MKSFEEAKQQWESNDDWHLADRDAERQFFYLAGKEELRAELAEVREEKQDVVKAAEVMMSNPPTEAEKVKAVLEAADEFEQVIAECTDEWPELDKLIEAVRKWRK